MAVTMIRYAPVYLTEGREWIDASALRGNAQDAATTAKKDAELLPQWAKDNKLIRIAKVEVREIAD